MKLDTNNKILIIGLGLLGGSYAMGLKKKGFFVCGISKEQKSIDYALQNNIIDNGTTQIDEQLIADADIIIFALYPHVFVDWIKQYGHLIKPHTLVTDVTGVKQSVVYEVQNSLPDGVEFISAHPMAGKETSGVEASDNRIFENANYIVVPTNKNTQNGIETCKALGEALGFARISVLSPKEHDSMIAFLSQLTHCIAVSLMCANDNPNLVQYTGDSFRDLTRIADINDEMWSELFLENKQALLAEMDAYRATFEKLYQHIKNDERQEMREMMRISTTRRRKFNKKA